MPKDILERLGPKDTTMRNGDFWILETQYEAKIIKELRNSDPKVLKRDD